MTIYRCGVFDRRPGLSDADFRAHWINVHGVLAKKLPGLGTYRQNHILERLYEATDSPVQAIDGVSQLSFDTVADMVRSDASTEYAACKEDIPKFQGGITVLVLESDEIMPAASSAPAPVKLLWVSTRRDGQESAGLRQRWLEANRNAARDVPGARRFVQNFVTDRGHAVKTGALSGDPSGAESVSELWFDDTDQLKAAVGSEAGKRLLHGDNLLRPVGIYRVEEVRIA